MPMDLYPVEITPVLEKQVSARETIYDLEDIECSETAKYSSSYTSPIIQYLKGNLPIPKYLESVTDYENKKEVEGDNQLSIFNLLDT